MSARRVRLLLLAAGLMAAACGPSGAASSGGPLATPSLPLATPVPSPHGDILTSGASIGYDGFRDWVRTSGGNVALVRVVGVGPVRWNSSDGTRPPEAMIEMPSPANGGHFVIGRVVSVERIRVVAGSWPPSAATADYWRPGGSVGLDSFDAEIPLPDFVVGQRAIAFMGSGGSSSFMSWDGLSIPVQIGWLFPVDAAGRVQTLDPRETITLDTIASYLP